MSTPTHIQTPGATQENDDDTTAIVTTWGTTKEGRGTTNGSTSRPDPGNNRPN